MRIVYIAAGAGGTYCEVCKRDIALAQGLMDRGHEVLVFPLYTPLGTEGPAPVQNRIFFGGINAWLQQNVPLFRRTPRFIDWLFDRPSLLRLVCRFAIETDPSELGEMTVSVLRGRQGHQRKELDRLMDFLESIESPDVLALTNSLLSVIGPEAKERLGVPVICSLEGEEEFVDQLTSPWREEALELIRSYARGIDLFTAPYAEYAEKMRGFLEVAADDVRTISPGIDTSGLHPAGVRPRLPFRVGYCGPVSRNKGVDLVVRGFERLAEDRRTMGHPPELFMASHPRGDDSRLRESLFQQIEGSGLDEWVEFGGVLERSERVEFMHRCSVMVMPSRMEELTAVPCLEAMACGLPVVASDVGVHREIIERTGGGVLVAPNDDRALAEALAELRDNPERADEMGRRAARGVERHFSGGAMAENMEEIFRELIG